jgi:tetratricopeptide (TPR) repeat protein
LSVPTLQEDRSRREKLLELAEQEFTAGNLGEAKRLLLRVIEGADDSESRDFHDEGCLCVRLLNTDDFVNYVHVMRKDGNDDDVRFVGSIRARALWRLGYICVECSEFREAVEHLERAHRVLPRSAKITIELAVCHGIVGNHETALILFESIGDVGYYVTAGDRARSLRGVGAQLTELGRYGDALNAFAESLRYEKSKLALNEIEYVHHLMAGGEAVEARAVGTEYSEPSCIECGTAIRHGYSGMRDGRVIYLCPECERRTRRTWWQFWRARRPELLRVQVESDRVPPASN